VKTYSSLHNDNPSSTAACKPSDIPAPLLSLSPLCKTHSETKIISWVILTEPDVLLSYSRFYHFAFALLWEQVGRCKSVSGSTCDFCIIIGLTQTIKTVNGRGSQDNYTPNTIATVNRLLSPAYIPQVHCHSCAGLHPPRLSPVPSQTIYHTI
jgi:hypothetical protein